MNDTTTETKREQIACARPACKDTFFKGTYNTVDPYCSYRCLNLVEKGKRRKIANNGDIVPGSVEEGMLKLGNFYLHKTKYNNTWTHSANGAIIETELREYSLFAYQRNGANVSKKLVRRAPQSVDELATLIKLAQDCVPQSVLLQEVEDMTAPVEEELNVLRALEKELTFCINIAEVELKKAQKDFVNEGYANHLHVRTADHVLALSKSAIVGALQSELNRVRDRMTNEVGPSFSPRATTK